jgi:hypothetical protein
MEPTQRRWKPIPRQKDALEEAFYQCAMPDTPAVVQLGLDLDISARQVAPFVRRNTRAPLARAAAAHTCHIARVHRQVRIWFQNRRQRERKDMLRRSPAVPASVAERSLARSAEADVDARELWIDRDQEHRVRGVLPLTIKIQEPWTQAATDPLLPNSCSSHPSQVFHGALDERRCSTGHSTPTSLQPAFLFAQDSAHLASANSQMMDFSPPQRALHDRAQRVEALDSSQALSAELGDVDQWHIPIQDLLSWINSTDSD